MSIEDEGSEDQSHSLELKRHRSRLSSKRTREKERSMMETLEGERSRLYLSNTALQYHNNDIREAIQAIKNLASKSSSSVASSTSTPASENSNSNLGIQPQTNDQQQQQHQYQYNQIGTTAPTQWLQNNPNPTLPQHQLGIAGQPQGLPQGLQNSPHAAALGVQQQLPQTMVPSLPANPLNPLAHQANPLIPSAAAALNVRLLQSMQQQASLQSIQQQASLQNLQQQASLQQSIQQQASLQTALQAEMNRLAAGGPLNFPTQMQPPQQPQQQQQPVNLVDAATAAVALSQLQQVSLQVPPQTDEEAPPRTQQQQQDDR